MQLFSFDFSKPLLFSLPMSLSLFVYFYIEYYLIQLQQWELVSILNAHNIHLFFESLGGIAPLILLSILYFKTRKNGNNTMHKSTVLDTQLAFTQVKKKKFTMFFKYYFLFLCGLMSSLIPVEYLVVRLIRPFPLMNSLIAPLYFFLSNCYCKVFLDFKLFGHHYIGYVFILLSYSLVIVYSLAKFANELLFGLVENTLPVMVLLIIVPLREVTEKYLMDSYFISAYLILCYESLVQLIVLFCIFIFPRIPNGLIFVDLILNDKLIDGNSFRGFYLGLKTLFANKASLWVFIIIANNNLLNVSRVILNEKYNPLQRFNADNFCLIYCYILHVVDSKDEEVSILSIIPYAVIFVIVNTFGTLLKSLLYGSGVCLKMSEVKS